MRKKRVGGEKSTPYLARMSPFDRIATTITALASGAEPSLEVLSAQAGMSPAHFQRTFRRLAGVSPLRFSQVMKVEVAREALLRSRSVLDAAWDAGLSGPGRLHDAMLSIERMTPGELKQGLPLRWSEASTSLGTLTLAFTSRGLCGADFGGLEALQARWPRAEFAEDRRGLKKDVARVEQRLAGATRPLSIVLNGTELQVAVWRALLSIPEGSLATYGQLAAQVGKPEAVRAVASAVGANPLAILIPCHRVIRSTGALGGYRWGLERKAALLCQELESARV
jgi:AraC family transcriptional regulator of adaptative response/methylated-DNA-[protein]-cysteine methyltransferase